MAEPAERGHYATDEAAQQRCAAAGEAPVIGERLGEAHGDARAERGGEPHHERIPGAAGGEGGGEEGGKRRDRAIHQPGQSRLHVTEDEELAAGGLFLGFRPRAEFLRDELLGLVFVLGLGHGEVAEQLADRGIGAAAGGALVEAARLQFHELGLTAELVDAEIVHQDERLAADEAAHVLAADEGDVLAEFLPVELDQTVAVLVFLFRHALEHFGGGGVVLAHRFGVVGVDAGILFFVADGEREDLAFAEFGEIFHASLLP